ncbi:hypothetical protein BH23CHL2_BH23CHL2_28420 [soil metagenome]
MSGIDIIQSSSDGSIEGIDRRRFIIEFAEFDDLGRTHVEMLLTMFDIKGVSRQEIGSLRQSTPFFSNLLSWDLVLQQLDSIAEPASIRFGALDPSLTRRDLEEMQDRARDLAKLYAPIRFVAFEFTPTVDETTMNSLVDQGLAAADLNESRPDSRPEVRETTLERLPAVPPDSLLSSQALRDDSQFYAATPNEGGIGAVDVWNELGGKGYGVRYVDIEYGWELNHQDLPIVQDPYDGTYSYKLRDINDKEHIDHGTGMLGIISAQHNDHGIYGIAPEAEPFVLSRLRARNIDNLPGAINLACAKLLRPGDVLLVEAQHLDSNNEFLPVERDPAVFAAIEFGVSLGITIIEPAGNSGVDLDDSGKFPPKGRRSGAIIVAAGMLDAGEFVKWGGAGKGSTNFGGIVDCFAWGGDVRSLTSDLVQVSTVRPGATSAASATIAGAAILIQSLYRARFLDDSVIWPEDMRSLLTDSSGMGSKAGENIGIMPNLRRLFDAKSTWTNPLAPPPKVKVKNLPDSLREALGLDESSDASTQSDIPRLVSFSSYSMLLPVDPGTARSSFRVIEWIRSRIRRRREREDRSTKA